VAIEISFPPPQPRQELFFSARERYVCYGGARGGGKNWCVQHKSVLMAARYSGIRILILRRTLPELRENHIRPMRRLLRGAAEYRATDKTFEFPNGSLIVFGYCDGGGDVEQYQGQEYDVIFMDGVAWCMEFVQWVYAQAGAPLPYKTASCGSLLDWYRKHRPECIVRSPIPGCIVIFDFPGTRYATDHTGIFVEKSATHITTIDGNTSGGSDANGGWVERRTRSLGYAGATYIKPRELVSGGEEDETVKRYQTLEEIRKDAPWAYPTIRKLVEAKALGGNGQGLDLSEDMLREFVVNDRMGLYK